MLGKGEGCGGEESHQAGMLGPKGSMTARKVMRREKPNKKVRVWGRDASGL